jgi:excisionase family DNA binding protein
VIDLPPLTVAQVARRLAVSQGLVRKLIKSGEIPHYRFRRLVKIAEIDVQAYLDASRRLGRVAITPTIRKIHPVRPNRIDLPRRHLRPPP